jgi:hypothetical protein
MPQRALIASLKGSDRWATELQTLLIRLEASSEVLRREMARAESMIASSTSTMDKSLTQLDTPTCVHDRRKLRPERQAQA